MCAACATGESTTNVARTDLGTGVDRGGACAHCGNLVRTNCEEIATDERACTRSPLSAHAEHLTRAPARRFTSLEIPQEFASRLTHETLGNTLLT
jgi:hypothetical protein